MNKIEIIFFLFLVIIFVSVHSLFLLFMMEPLERKMLLFGASLHDPEFVSRYLREGDIVGVAMSRGKQYVENMLSQVPPENRMIIAASFQDLDSFLQNLSIDISYIGYDLERWPYTSRWEQENPVDAVRIMGEIAHSHGLQLVVAPSRYFNERFGEEIAKYADIYIPQAKYYQAFLSLDEYNQTLRNLIGNLRAANPNLIIFLDLSTSPKGRKTTAEEMWKHVEVLEDVIDGVWVTYSPLYGEEFRRFLQILRG